MAVARAAITCAPSETGADRKSQAWRLLSLATPALLTLLCFLNAIGNDFTNWDDPSYVVDNELIRSVSITSIKEMFSTFLVGNYHPLTVLSLAIDYAIYELKPSGYHLTNVLLHVCNVILVALFVQLLVGRPAVSFVTATLFGIHPMHVESVAWISERKDVLYTFFYLSSMCAYMLYARRSTHNGRCYAVSLGLFVCSLFSKGQAVTLPIVLLLIDYCDGRRWTRSTLVEKLPFFALALAFGVIAIVAQKVTGAIPDLPVFSLGKRLIFAGLNVSLYTAKLIVPIRLSAFYPYPAPESWGFYVVSCLPVALAMGVLGVFVYRITRGLAPRRFVEFGGAFFVVNIVLLLQIVPVGSSIISERYSYLCSLGFFLALGCVIQSLLGNSRNEVKTWKTVISCVLVLYSGWLAYATIERNKVWRGSEPLWSDVLQQFPQTALAYLSRGSYYDLSGDPNRALEDYNMGLAIKPNYYDILVNRCAVYRTRGEYERALADCNHVIENASDKTVAYTNRGIIYSLLRRYDDALSDFEKAISLEPKNAKLYSNRGNLYDMQGLYDTAIENYSYAISIQPDYYAAYYNRGKTQLRKGEFAAAVQDFDVSVRSNSLAADSYFYRSQSFRALGDLESARRDARSAQQAGRALPAFYSE